ncbi:MAG: protein phosphatase 2C domain-containing protein [Chitinophagales bacterium]|nr:protein phosphatase 2C domain-containing protein [Chitinophagales bacterium]
MELKQIVYHQHQGRREYQEDSYAHGADFIMVSDGVGGQAKGEVASDIVSSIWREAAIQHVFVSDNLEEKIQEVVAKTIETLKGYVVENPDGEGMGATLAYAGIVGDNLVAIHIGDSRIYHFGSDGRIKWRTKDHSLVQELVDGGIIAPEAAATHPRRNIITRVLQAKEGALVKADFHLLTDIEEGDIIMVCSDGIMESWSDEGLESVIHGKKTIEDSIKEIGDHSAEMSNDNNTAVMALVAVSIDDAPIETVKDGSSTTSEVTTDVKKEVNESKDNIIQEESPENIESPHPDNDKQKKPGISDKMIQYGKPKIFQSKKWKRSKVLFIGIVVIGILYLLCKLMGWIK